MIINVDKEKNELQGYINPKKKNQNFVFMIIFWIVCAILLLGSYVMAYFVNFKRLEQSTLSVLLKIGLLLVFGSGLMTQDAHAASMGSNLTKYPPHLHDEIKKREG